MREEDLERLLGDVHGDDPSPQFVTSLRARLEQELAEGPPPARPLDDRPLDDDDLSDPRLVTPPGDAQRPGSAKWWIRGGLAVAAAALIVVGIVVADDGQDTTRLATEQGDPAADTVPPDTAPASTVDPPAVFSTGDVQVTLRWPESIVDAVVLAPGGEVVSWVGLPEGGPSPSGARIEGDETGPCGDSDLASNTFWPAGEAPSGEYAVIVSRGGETGCGQPIDYMLEVNVLGESVASESGTLAKGESAAPVNFEIP